MRRILLDGVGAVAVSLVLYLAYAPAPLPRPLASRPPAAQDLACKCTWACEWGTVKCVLHFTRNGHYLCDWPGSTYVGTWALDARGRLWITESCRPHDASSWQSYCLTLSGSRRRGYVGSVRVGSTDQKLTLKLKE